MAHAALLDVLDNGSVLFVFLTGFLFELHVDRFRYRTYLRRRFISVVLPYLVLSVPLVAYDVLYRHAWTKHPGQLSGTSSLYQFAWFLAKGKVPVNYTMWFVPTIVLFYLASPLFVHLARHPRWYALVMVVLVPLSMLLQRSPDSVTLMALYFLGAYVMGMWVSRSRSRVEPWLVDRWPWLLGVFVLTTVTLLVFAQHHGNYVANRPFSHDDGFVDWLFPQKLLLCLGLLGLLLHVQSRVGEQLRLFADISKALFFFHVPVLYCLEIVVGGLPGNVIDVLATAFVAIAAVTAGTLVTRQVLGERSRYLIGS